MRLQAENGQPKEPDIYVPFEAIPFDKEKYPILGSVAPYYDTIFNPDQCARFVIEWDLAASEPEYKNQTQEWKIVRDTAAQCIGQRLYLKFIGD
jgi:hypothetical protein